MVTTRAKGLVNMLRQAEQQAMNSITRVTVRDESQEYNLYFYANALPPQSFKPPWLEPNAADRQ